MCLDECINVGFLGHSASCTWLNLFVMLWILCLSFANWISLLIFLKIMIGLQGILWRFELHRGSQKLLIPVSLALTVIHTSKFEMWFMLNMLVNQRNWQYYVLEKKLVICCLLEWHVICANYWIYMSTWFFSRLSVHFVFFLTLQNESLSSFGKYRIKLFLYDIRV